MKTKHILRLLLLLIPFLMEAQKDSLFLMNPSQYCLIDVTDIIKKNRKVITYYLPEDFESDSTKYKIDSNYVFLSKSKFLQQTYTSEKIRFKTLLNEEKKIFLIEDLNAKKKAKIEFTEPCEITFTGTKRYYENNSVRLFFKAKYDGYEQEFSLHFGKFGNRKGIILNSGHPQYRKCTP